MPEVQLQLKLIASASYKYFQNNRQPKRHKEEIGNKDREDSKAGNGNSSTESVNLGPGPGYRICILLG
jgi:hypothetical protein